MKQRTIKSSIPSFFTIFKLWFELKSFFHCTLPLSTYSWTASSVMSVHCSCVFHYLMFWNVSFWIQSLWLKRPRQGFFFHTECFPMLILEILVSKSGIITCCLWQKAQSFGNQTATVWCRICGENLWTTNPLSVNTSKTMLILLLKNIITMYLKLVY